MRWIAVCVFLCAATAAAQPVSYQLRPEVALGEKPQLRITAATNVTDVRFELARDDGKQFTLQHGALAKNQAVTLSFGDGAAGKATYTGTVSAHAAGAAVWSENVTFETVVRPPVHVGYDADHLDLDAHVLQFTMSRRAGRGELTVIGDDGSQLATASATYKQEAAGTWLSITWTQPAGTRVLMLKLHVESADAGITDVQLVPWSVSIDHEDVNFATDSAVIEPSEDAKLEASVAKIGEVVKRTEQFVKLKLFVAGHTDTVGPSAKNRTLSLDRARAIAAYVRKHGIALPIAYAGYGEDVLKVPTRDNTDERANRRADYVIGPAGAPLPFKGPYLKAHATWTDLR